MIKCRKRRAHRNPEKRQSTHKGSKPPERNHLRKFSSKKKPTAQVNQCHKNQSKRKRQWKRPRLEMDVEFGRHRQVDIHGRGVTSPAPSAMAREALRAGACPAGCSVLRKATSAVVSAGLRFFP